MRIRDDTIQDDTPFELDNDGFLAEPEESATLSAGQLIRPSVAVGRGALVLLGEPGSGKTTTFKEIIGDRPTGAGEGAVTSEVVWVDGNDIRSIDDFRDYLAVYLDALPMKNQEPAPVLPQLTIVLDQLDESPFIRSIPKRLDLALRGRDTRSLTFLIACRTADYPSSLTKVLDDVALGCLVADLAPLTKQDVISLMAGGEIDPGNFLEFILANHVGPLASIPLTLKMLADSYREDAGKAIVTSHELFRRSVLRLADEHDRDRESSRPIGSTAEQRVVIASRVAARVVLAGQRTIFRGVAADANESDVTDGTISGGVEYAAGGEFQVSPISVAETLATGLFTSAGKDRVAFVHSSVAAYLAACYLEYRSRGDLSNMKKQLGGVFLVAAPDEDSASIPIHLRETAAWLLECAPADALWLGRADPQGIIAHSGYINSPRTREALVAELLDRAAEVELTGNFWFSTRWQLNYPGLAGQLRPVLQHAADNPSADWAEFARARLAIQLARDSVIPNLAGDLLKIAEQPGWPAGLRQRAASAAYEASSAVAAPRLKKILSSLDATSGGIAERELMGTIFSLLWPDELALADVLPHISRSSGSSRTLYRWEINRFPRLLREEDIASLLTHLNGVIEGGAEIVDVDEFAESESDLEPTVVKAAVADLSTELIDAVVDRTLRSPDALEYLSQLAPILINRLIAGDRVNIPIAVDLVDQESVEPAGVRTLRHALVESLVYERLTQSGAFHRSDALMIALDWEADSPILGYRIDDVPENLQRSGRSRLVDSRDFRFGLQRVDALRSDGRSELAQALGQLYCSVVDISDLETFEFAYTRRETPEWEHLKWFYEGIRIDSQLADSLRMNRVKKTVWEHAEEFAEEQRQLLNDALSEKLDDFWRFIHNLRADPATGRFVHEVMSRDDIREFPGAKLWGPDEFEEKMIQACTAYLSLRSDLRESWLGTRSTDRRAVAGYLSAHFLASKGLLGSVAVGCWRSWVGAIIDHAMLLDDIEKSPVSFDLLRHCVQHAGEEFKVAVVQYVRTCLTRGDAPLGLKTLWPALSVDMVAPLISLSDEIRDAMNGWDGSDDGTFVGVPVEGEVVVTEGPVQIPHTRQGGYAATMAWVSLMHLAVVSQKDVAIASLGETFSSSAMHNSFISWSAEAGCILLQVEPEEFWDRVYVRTLGDPALARKLAEACVRSYSSKQFIEELSITHLYQAFNWVSSVASPEAEVYKLGVHAPLPDHELHDWRNSILSALVERGDSEAVRQVRRIAMAHKDNLRIQSALLEARKRAQANAVVTLTSGEVIELLSDKSRRVVNTEFQLAEVVIEAISDIKKLLIGHDYLLWDGERDEKSSESRRGKARPLKWRPKPEGTLAAYLANQLSLRLANRRVLVNREVVVRPTGPGDSGERPDLLVEAFVESRSISEEMAILLRVPVEIKGSWHHAVRTAQFSQLANRYLRYVGSDAGVYVIGLFRLSCGMPTMAREKDELKEWALRRLCKQSWIVRQLRYLVPRESVRFRTCYRLEGESLHLTKITD
ncbi:NACHT domain-containing protein [Amycolatopsis tolypomycina]|uniref:NACHT domain-containing protein n=1 Tax=Amycolatopsis tolypomycina TaxID=208445 RepID=UPI0033B13F7E